MRELGYEVIPTGEGTHLLAGAIVQRFATNAGGELELVTEGSTSLVSTTLTHAGIVAVERYDAFAPVEPVQSGKIR